MNTNLHYDDVVIYEKKYANDFVSGHKRLKDVIDLITSGSYYDDDVIETDGIVIIPILEWNNVLDRDAFIHAMAFDFHIHVIIRQNCLYVRPMTEKEIDIFESEED